MRSVRSVHSSGSQDRLLDFVARGPHPVGVATTEVADGAGRTLPTDIWYPADPSLSGRDLEPDLLREAPQPVRSMQPVRERRVEMQVDRGARPARRAHFGGPVGESGCGGVLPSTSARTLAQSTSATRFRTSGEEVAAVLGG